MVPDGPVASTCYREGMSGDVVGAPVTRDAVPDLELGPRYELLASLAAGGMGTVYLGRASEDDGTSIPVAVKVLHPHLAQDPEVVAMFVDEARVATRLHHPNAVHVRGLRATAPRP